MSAMTISAAGCGRFRAPSAADRKPPSTTAPIRSAHLFATLARQVGLESGQIGEGAAISLYLFPVLVFVVWAQLKSVRKEVL